MGNTGYKSFASLELYYPDDNSYAGITKANVSTDPDYIAPILDTATCSPSARYYNTVRTLVATRNNCSSGYIGSSVTLTVNANQFASDISIADANAQADSWLTANAQAYANNAGTCTLDTTTPSCPCSGCIGAEDCYTVTVTVPVDSNIGVKHTTHLGANVEGPLEDLEAMDNLDGTYTYNVCSTAAPVFYTISNHQEIVWEGGSFSLASCSNYYSTVRTLTATRNNCSSGYSGSSVTLTANANQFVSAISIADANAQADSWLAANVQSYANTSGTCAPPVTYPYCEGTTRWYSPTSFQYDSLICGGNGFGGTCVVEGTVITMFDGTTKKVEDLVLGDKLRSKAVAGLKDNEENNETWKSESLTLTDCEVEVVKCEPSEVQLLNNINEGQLKISDSHIHLVKKDAEWRLLRTYELSIGDFMVDEFGNEVEITSIGLLNGGFTIYDLGVEENDLYIANGILTHNK